MRVVINAGTGTNQAPLADSLLDATERRLTDVRAPGN